MRARASTSTRASRESVEIPSAGGRHAHRCQRTYNTLNTHTTVGEVVLSLSCFQPACALRLAATVELGLKYFSLYSCTAPRGYIYTIWFYVAAFTFLSCSTVNMQSSHTLTRYFFEASRRRWQQRSPCQCLPDVPSDQRSMTQSVGEAEFQSHASGQTYSVSRQAIVLLPLTNLSVGEVVFANQVVCDLDAPLDVL